MTELPEDFQYRVDKLKIRPGDVLKVSTEHMLTPDQCKKLADNVKRQFPNNQVIVVTAGIQFDVDK